MVAPPTCARVTKATTFEAAHRVPGHPKCGNLHGHSWRVEATVEGPVPDDGMVFDFGVLGGLLKDLVHERFDHRTILGELDRDEIGQALEFYGQHVEYTAGPPTSENVALAIVEALKGPLLQLTNTCRLVKVAVWETVNSYVEVRL